MSKIINLEILGQPINILIIILFILAWYFGAFGVAKRALSGVGKTATGG